MSQSGAKHRSESSAPITLAADVALAAASAALTALAGVLTQPLARLWTDRAESNRPGAAGLLVLPAGVVLAAIW